MEFEKFPKIARYAKEAVTITEKIDGTNAALLIEGGALQAASRSRLITPDDDNHGFARWAYENTDELVELLGEGRHFGEWWGHGIQRGYGLKNKFFSLFNTYRFRDLAAEYPAGLWIGDHGLGVVPVLADEVPLFMLDEVLASVELELEVGGSHAAPNALSEHGIPAEGLMIYFHELRTYLKAPFGKAPKSTQLPEALAA